jgi:hypothetical protein
VGVTPGQNLNIDGHKVEFSLVRDLVNSLIEAIRTQLTEEKNRMTAEYERVAEKNRIAEETHRLDE